MSDTHHKPKKFKAPNRLVLLGVSGLVIVGGLLTYQIVRAEGRILPNVSVGGIAVGNLSPEQAREKLERALQALNLTGVEFIYEDRSLAFKANEKSAAPASQSVITYDIDAMVNDAYLAGNEDEGRAGFIVANIQALFSSIILPAEFEVDEGGMKGLLRERFGDLEHEPVSATVRVVEGDDGAADIGITPETVGTAFDYDEAVRKAISGLSRWQGGSFALALERHVPEITQNKAESMRGILLAAHERGEVTLGFDDLTWMLSGRDFTDALTLKAHPDGSLYPGLEDDALDILLLEAADAINQAPHGTHLVLNEDGDRATEFEGGQVGRWLNRDASIRLVDERLATDDPSVIPLVVDLNPAPDSDPIAEELGIRELIGWGTSDFSGSPTNRRKNIRNGVERLWGWLIPPGEEFGVLEKLRPFDASGGYVQELVIKGDRTIREYGGGLCQIGTTTFRAVMGAGLPITARQNHSYAVSYYAPAGTDATIYDPAPDFRFINDTEEYVLLITTMYDNKLRFEFWGTRDGRVQERTEIKRWNSVEPPEPKKIPTSALAPGEERCFEIGHHGLTASFDYIITYADGHKDEQTFTSVYKPWQSQCLVGEEGAPNIKLEWDGSLKEYPPEGQEGEVKGVQFVPDDAQCSAGGCAG